MNKFWHHTHKSSTDSVTSVTGFHDGYIYKIINKYDDSVIHLENYITTPGASIVAEEDTDSDCQRFRTSRIREGEEGGEFEISSMHQNPSGPVQVWEYRQDTKILVQNSGSGVAGSDPNQLWVAVEKSEGSRIYFIKPRSEDVCLTNMGIGQPIGLYAPDPSDRTQHWVLEPTDYTE
ncbi:uncharacterized protein LOC110848676 isoform X2 [Folsomia candida]|uniref:uncharacterized protein LOC110848676 isoform X2 n=1 Tax=Folsomia candida TaxID=158441 RepID=UPI000B8F4DD2|nr:uncharacterized protein LOC110848676 isoform X2 [Folsomia candida]